MWTDHVMWCSYIEFWLNMFSPIQWICVWWCSALHSWCWWLCCSDGSPGTEYSVRLKVIEWCHQEHLVMKSWLSHGCSFCGSLSLSGVPGSLNTCVARSRHVWESSSSLLWRTSPWQRWWTPVCSRGVSEACDDSPVCSAFYSWLVLL